MAGTGKSSIAHTLSESLDASLIIPTIAYQLSKSSPLLRSAISQAIEDEPEVGSLHPLSKQFRLLLVEPMKRALSISINSYKLIITNAVDECTRLGTVESLIKSIVTFSPPIPLKFFISSRELTTIQNAIHSNPSHTPKLLPLHGVERAVVQKDIETYLQFSLSAIAQRSLHPIPWPPLDELDILLERSDRLFIYAATAVRYIGVPDVDLRKRLFHITRLTPSRMQTGVIDSLYNDIMQQAFHSNLETDYVSPRRETLSAVVFLQVPSSIDGIASLLNMDSLEARIALAPFCSVINVPAADMNPVSTFHASFRDYIIDPSRCPTYFLDVFEGHRMLTVKCLRCLNQSLKRNICNLDFNKTFLPSQESNAFHEGLRYSCLHWASHLVHALERASVHTSVKDVQDLLSAFVNNHLLHWFECLGALREIASGIKSLDIACETISVSTKLIGNKNIDQFFSPAFSKNNGGFEGILPLLEDSRRFLQFASEPINRHPLETYHSSLVWIPKKSLMRDQYANAFRNVSGIGKATSDQRKEGLYIVLSLMKMLLYFKPWQMLFGVQLNSSPCLLSNHS